MKYIDNVTEEVMDDFIPLFPADPNNPDNVNNALYNSDGTINKNAVLLSPQYAAYTLEEFGQVSTPMKNQLIATADAPNKTNIELFIASGLGDAMFERYELIRAPNGRVTAILNDVSGHIDMPKRVTNALRFMYVQAKVGDDPEEIGKKLIARTEDRLANPEKYTYQELIKAAGGPLQGIQFIDQVHRATEDVLKEISDAYYNQTEEGKELFVEQFRTSTYATPVTSIAIQRLLEDHIYDVLSSGNKLDSNAAIKDEVSKYLHGLVKNNPNFGFSQFHWSQDGIAFQTGTVDFSKLQSTGTLSIMPFEKQMSVNGDFSWAIDMVNRYIRQSDLYEQGLLRDDNARFGGRIRVDALDYTSPARYALIHIDDDGTISQLKAGGEDIIIDSVSEKRKYIQKFRPGEEQPEYNYDITRQFK